jgi:predicted permease
MMLWQDCRYSVRALRRSPGFTIAAALTLAVGIGATTAIFTVFNAVLLRPLPYPGTDRLFVIQEGQRTRVPVNALHFREWRASSRSFDEMAIIGPDSVTLGSDGSGEPTRLNIARVSPSLFRTLGVRPALGRAFLEAEDVAGRDRVVILTHELWQARFGADPHVVGRRVMLDGEPYEIVGVLPPGQNLPKLQHLYPVDTTIERPQLWKPFAPTERDERLLGNFNYVAIGRLKQSATPQQADQELNAIEAELARRAPEPVSFHASLLPLGEQIVSRSSAALRLVLAAGLFVLLIACVNVTNLLVARAKRRGREFAIRRAAGASLHRLLLQALTETLVLCFGAGVLALPLAAALVRLIHLNSPADVPRIEEATIDLPVLLFTFAITSISGLVIGLAPAWRAARGHAAELLRTASVTAAGSRAAGRFRALLIGVEVGASAVCLISGALLLTSFANVMSVDRGFSVDRIITTDFTLPEPRYDVAAAARYLETLTARVRALPGVTSVGVTDALPLSGLSNSAIMVEGSTLPRAQRPSAMIRFADRGYFQTMGIAPVAGRLLEDTDAGRGVAVISSRAAQRIWPNQNPLGKRFRHGPDDSPLIQVVGVVSDVRAISLTADPPLQIYRPTADYFYGRASLAVKTESEPAAVAASIQRIMRELDPQLAVPTPRTMADIVDASVAQRRFQMMLVMLLAATAAFLAAIGVYAVAANAVTARLTEFGVRISLGANSANIRRLVLSGALRPVLFGLAGGIFLSIGFGRLLRTLLFEVSPTDPASIAAASLSLIAVTALATLIPAQRATHVDPVIALKAE